MKNALILGGGVSGRAAAELAELLGWSSRIVSDNDCRDIPDDTDIIIASPGMHPLHSRLYQQSAASGKEFTGELDFAASHLDIPMVAVTGTNGKTTTTELTTHLLNALDLPAIAAGNIGLPLSAVTAQRLRGELPELKAVVVEVSSFQLELADNFMPEAAVLLNLASDHVDRYRGGFNEYCRIKRSLLERIKPGNRILGLSFDDAGCRVNFSGDWLTIDGRKILPVSETRLNAPHNRENLAAAAELILRLIPSPDTGKLADAIRSFSPGAHRIEKVAEIHDVTYINDSKATNPAAVLAAVATFNTGKIVIIMGGLGKGMDFSPLSAICHRLRGAVLIGESRCELYKTIAPAVPCYDCGSDFALAVATAKRLAEPGDTVLLSPACASMDMFKSYAERGDIFRQLVLEDRS